MRSLVDIEVIESLRNHLENIERLARDLEDQNIDLKGRMKDLLPSPQAAAPDVYGSIVDAKFEALIGFLRKGDKIHAIKILREISGLNLHDSKWVCDALESTAHLYPDNLPF